MKVEIDIKLISSFIRKATSEDASANAKRLLNRWRKMVKDYVIDAATDKHYVVVDDVDKFNELIEEIKKG